ncbi:hypothetical protein DY000_02031965 [Brassica cretica]|uniref:Dof zinc finger protein n=1 Tax=Brassica cretica TaxID=69181 RepID=A0ABQ7DMK3_BRACR|nr:hypothetical protein DY000_02031965 [Brassica cretica]
MEQIISNTSNNTSQQQQPQGKVNCPRCNATNTKFCYYNNYSLTQPRYFCKGCRRYWTEGGSLRNVPVGGSSRKNKRSSTPLASPSNPKLPDLNPQFFSATQIPNKSSKDLNLLPFPVMQDQHHASIYASSSHGASSRGMNTLLPGQMMDSNSVLYSSLGIPTMADYKQSNNNLSFSIDHHQGIGHNTINNNHRAEDNNHADDMNGASRVLFPFSDTKEFSSTNQEKSHNTYWSGMFSNTGGSSW